VSLVVFSLNGKEVAVPVRPETRLLDVLRDQFGLTGAKIGCRIGRCGACAVLLDGKLANACLLMAYQLEGAHVITSEALDLLPAGRAARRALADEIAFQCGYCAPGMTVAMTALLLAESLPGEEAAREALSGNLCRCSGYLSILRAAEGAARLYSQESEGSRA
jgi:carbon-monoxide dehydrogenase small subunit